ncbi:FAD-linked sulfhydryl oxidase ALR isoform X1 [Nilaparvata lugens]|uniref:FAD-linked sulfhydryl oxidase ALR isoform X1 n=1 Tax=Nilaparvata lugens TaxID=108931 RepID=UPI000B982BCC|nr:FAD-linked sulfhydryl oxidase ALR isoform X1 [Nilaparvata lugens]
MPSRPGFDYYNDIDNQTTTPLPQPGKKPCRTCTDFKSWAKLQGDKDSQKQSEGNSNLSGARKVPEDCPLDRDQLGSKTWAFLHTMAAYYPDQPSSQQQTDMTNFFTLFSRFYPCEACASHLRKQLKASPPMVQSQTALSQWLCWVHNNVNKRIGKPQFDCKQVNARWRDGWPDGSCD